MPGRFAFTIDAAVENIPLVTDALEDYLTSAGADPLILPDIQLAVNEATTNIVTHGYMGKPGIIGITRTIGAGSVRIEIRDKAPAFNPLSVRMPDPPADLADQVTTGMGLFLIRKVMDAVSYDFIDGENVLTMEKKEE